MDRALRLRAARLAIVLAAGASLAACASLTTPKYSVREGAGGQAARPPASANAHGTMAPYQVGGIWYVPREQPGYDERGIASWYGDAFNMKATADGEIFDMSQFSAAHTTLPLPSMVEVTNLDNGRKLTVRVNDRGPFVGGRIIDLSHAAAQELGYDRAGIARVRVRYLGPAPLAGPEAGVRYAKASPAPGFAQTPAPIRAGRRPADEDIFQEASYTPATAADAAPRPLVAAPEPVTVSALAPLPAAARPVRQAAITEPPVTSSDNQGFRIQAGAYSDEDHARRAAAQLPSATVEPFDREGVTFYRVFVPGPADEAEAYAVRDKVAASGFADARVVRP
jgi:rare lipoprotein A